MPEYDRIRSVLASPEGHELAKYLRDAHASIQSIDSVKELEDPLAQAVEIRAQQKAAAWLRTVLERLLDISNAPTTVNDDNHFASL